MVLFTRTPPPQNLLWCLELSPVPRKLMRLLQGHGWSFWRITSGFGASTQQQRGPLSGTESAGLPVYQLNILRSDCSNPSAFRPALDCWAPGWKTTCGLTLWSGPHCHLVPEPSFSVGAKWKGVFTELKTNQEKKKKRNPRDVLASSKLRLPPFLLERISFQLWFSSLLIITNVSRSQKVASSLKWD